MDCTDGCVPPLAPPPSVRAHSGPIDRPVETKARPSAVSLGNFSLLEDTVMAYIESSNTALLQDMLSSFSSQPARPPRWNLPRQLSGSVILLLNTVSKVTASLPTRAWETDRRPLRQPSVCLRQRAGESKPPLSLCTPHKFTVRVSS